MITMREGIVNRQEICIATIAMKKVMQCTIALTQEDMEEEMTIEEEDNKSHPCAQDHLRARRYVTVKCLGVIHDMKVKVCGVELANDMYVMPSKGEGYPIILGRP